MNKFAGVDDEHLIRCLKESKENVLDTGYFYFSSEYEQAINEYQEELNEVKNRGIAYLATDALFKLEEATAIKDALIKLEDREIKRKSLKEEDRPSRHIFPEHYKLDEETSSETTKKETKKMTKQTTERKTLEDKEMGLKREGKEIILPEGMTFDTGIEWLKRMKEEDERVVDVYADIPCSPLDGLVAFHKALRDTYGWTALVPTPGFFGDNPPIQVSIPVGPNPGDTIQASYGRVQIPGIDGHLETGFNVPKGGLPSFTISGQVKRKNESIAQEVIAKTKKYLREESIYKGKAVKINFDFMNDERRYDIMKDAPRFMEASTITDKDLIFAKNVMDGLNVGLFTPIEHSAACREHKIPLKRGVLLHGPYGTGKTLTAGVTATKAVANGWTFIYLESVRDLQQGLQFAAAYAPAVIFAEDIDRAMHGNRSFDMDQILNTLDGIDTKGAEIITVLTTNHIEQINPTMLRMGRLDTLVEVTPPDAEAAVKLVKLYARDLLEDKVDLTKVGVALEGKIPAFIREVTERAKIAAIRSQGNGNIKGKVTQDNLLAAANAMEPHNALLAPKEETDRLVQLKDVQVRLPREGSKRQLNA